MANVPMLLLAVVVVVAYLATICFGRLLRSKTMMMPAQTAHVELQWWGS